MLAAAASSARGGRSSAAITGDPDPSCSQKRGHEPLILSVLASLLPARPCRSPHASRRCPASRSFAGPPPIDELTRLREALGSGPALLVKRDDAIPFGFGGNKVRKLQLVAARARGRRRRHADHVRRACNRITRARPPRWPPSLGMRCVLVANGAPPSPPDRERAAGSAAGRRGSLRRVPRGERTGDGRRRPNRPAREGRRPFVIPLGASTALGAAAYALAVGETARRRSAPPDVIVHATSSGGTQAGLVAGCRLHGLATRVIGISADDPAPALGADDSTHPRGPRAAARARRRGTLCGRRD